MSRTRIPKLAVVTRSSAIKMYLEQGDPFRTYLFADPTTGKPSSRLSEFGLLCNKDNMFQVDDGKWLIKTENDNWYTVTKDGRLHYGVPTHVFRPVTTQREVQILQDVANRRKSTT